jgi:hypothetical protein
MQRQNIIVLINIPDINDPSTTLTECYGSLKKACMARGWVYNTLVQKKLPQVKDGWLVQRVTFN